MKFDTLVKEIAEKYLELGHNMGWRFLCVPKAVLNARPQIALITLNPGGDSERPDHATSGSEVGCSYYTEQWGNVARGQGSLQLQVQGLFASIAKHTGYSGSNLQLMDESLVAYFVPFRSPSINTLHKKPESFAFAKDLWGRLMAEQSPHLVVTIDPATFGHMREILSSRFSVANHQIYETGWSGIRAETVWFGKRKKDVVALVRLPHLSRFRLYSRPQCAPYLEEIFRDSCAHF